MPLSHQANNQAASWQMVVISLLQVSADRNADCGCFSGPKARTPGGQAGEGGGMVYTQSDSLACRHRPSCALVAHLMNARARLRHSHLHACCPADGHQIHDICCDGSSSIKSVDLNLSGSCSCRLTGQQRLSLCHASLQDNCTWRCIIILHCSNSNWPSSAFHMPLAADALGLPLKIEARSS